jgi:hypothetical protein
MRSTEYKPWKGWLSKLLNIRLNTTKSGAKPGLPLGHDAGSLHQIPSYLMAILVLRTQRLYSSVHPFNKCLPYNHEVLSTGWRWLQGQARGSLFQADRLYEKYDVCMHHTETLLR